MTLGAKKNIYLLVLPICFLFIFNGKKYEDSVIARISVPVKICPVSYTHLTLPTILLV